jgi:ketosteroid isomerase-like protein
MSRTSSPEHDLELAERLFAAFEAGQIEAVTELLSDDFVLVVPPSMSAEPDRYEGPEGARRYMDAFDGAVDDVRFRADELLRHKPGCVLARVHLSGRGSSSGLPLDIESAAIIRLRDGKVTGIEPHPDLAAAREALAGR